MTDKLHCPFCGAELAECVADGYRCQNQYCRYRSRIFERNIWQALIYGKKAQDALKIVDGKLKVIANDENPSPIQSQALDCYIQIAKDCRDIITSITKQEE